METDTLPALPVLRRAVTLPLDEVEWRDSGNGSDYTMRGHAAVFGRLSEDLGGFRELIEAGAFRGALRGTPDVRLLFNHDPNYVMARTASGSLELREDQTGLHVWARVAPMQWVTDLRTSMQRGDVDQMSFAFTIRDGGDEWAIAEDGTVVRTIRADGVEELFDVSVVTFPAYPQTDAAMRSVLDDAVKRGRLALPGAAENDDAALQAAADAEARRRRILALRAQGTVALNSITKES